MPISKEDDKSSWEQYHIILLSHIVQYEIWSLLHSDETLMVTRVSPPIFALQHCCRFRKRMQLNMHSLRLNTLFLYFLFPSSLSFLPFLFLQFPFLLQFIFLLFLFSPSAYIDPYWLVLLSSISTSSHVPLASKGTFIKIECFKIKPCPSQKKMTRVCGSNIT